MAASPNYEVIECPVYKKGHDNIETNSDIQINTFVYSKNKVYPIYSAEQNHEN